jgi:anti-anti-sigma regulatory factor
MMRAGMILLPAQCSTSLAQSLLTALIDHADRAADVTIDGAAVDTIGQAVLQVLVSAKADADATGRAFRITAPSPALIERAVGCKLDRLIGLASEPAAAGETRA